MQTTFVYRREGLNFSESKDVVPETHVVGNRWHICNPDSKVVMRAGSNPIEIQSDRVLQIKYHEAGWTVKSTENTSWTVRIRYGPLHLTHETVFELHPVVKSKADDISNAKFNNLNRAAKFCAKFFHKCNKQLEKGQIAEIVQQEIEDASSVYDCASPEIPFKVVAWKTQNDKEPFVVIIPASDTQTKALFNQVKRSFMHDDSE